MAPFVVSQRSRLSTASAWARLTDWPEHARYVPLTAISVDPPGPSAVGTVVTARTAVGRLGFDDPMEITQWQPPADGLGGWCRLDKRGHVMLGWAELSVEPVGTGSVTIWREEARPARTPRLTDPASTLSGRMLFGRVLRKLLEA